MEDRVKLEKVKIQDLKPYGNNPRKTVNIEILEKSIEGYGFINPIIAYKHEGENVIIAGHHRIKAAKKNGIDEVPVIFPKFKSWSEARGFMIMDNRSSEMVAEWDNELLSLELGELQEFDFDLELTGFDVDEIASEPIEGLTHEDEVPEAPEEPKTKPGDIWLLGNHRLLCGDSTSIVDMERLMNGEFADLWITDPPYNVNYEGKTKDSLKIKNDSMEDSVFREFLRDSYVAANSTLRPGAVFYIWHADSEGYNFRGAANDIGWQVRQCLIWLKSTMVMGRQDYHWKHEPCLYGWVEGAAHYWGTDRKQTTVLEFDKPSRNKEHPTMKPVELFQYQISNSTKSGDRVLDSFGGSGTTLIACEKLRRSAYLMELDPVYCDVIVKRWEDFTGKKAVLSEG